MKIGGWKTEAIAKYYIGAISKGRVQGVKRQRDQRYAHGSRLPLSPEFENELAACAGQGGGKRRQVRVRQPRIRPVVYYVHTQQNTTQRRHEVWATPRVDEGVLIYKPNS